MARGGATTAEMRVQLQLSRAGTTLETYGLPVTAQDPIAGVTCVELRSALQQLYNQAKNLEIIWYPFASMESQLVEAIVTLSERIKRYPPDGIDGDRNIERHTWTGTKGKEFRLDIETKRGWNLCE